ncbi:hypothetical protein GS429_19020 [Natronorubrum sp. JWXQ-INN-674]|uniref:Uncharacterized protein n=1 Tax=Natronorubrum halalkaliphilum TaxID=2691917 RepID=A0A6B0VRG6_9EURY|nr:hypothetical protein [Natronorubrum halalkaliphilum]MXV64118.1 hypothetical protein [Natronorubrum halalkaliphilum]
MRLTPSWVRSSSADSERDCAGDPETTSGVTVYHSPGELSDDGPGSDERIAAFVPDADAELLAILAEMQTPATVDEVTDELIEPERPPVETWAAVHERLHEHRLPELDASDDIQFDASQGIVDCPTPAARIEMQQSAGVLGAVSIDLRFVLRVLLSAVLLGAVAFVVATTAFGLGY